MSQFYTTVSIYFILAFHFSSVFEVLFIKKTHESFTFYFDSCELRSPGFCFRNQRSFLDSDRMKLLHRFKQCYGETVLRWEAIRPRSSIRDALRLRFVLVLSEEHLQKKPISHLKACASSVCDILSELIEVSEAASQLMPENFVALFKVTHYAEMVDSYRYRSFFMNPSKTFCG